MAVLLRARLATMPASSKPKPPHGGHDERRTLELDVLAEALHEGVPSDTGHPLVYGRSRRGAGRAAKLPAKRGTRDRPAPIYQIRVDIRHAKPPIWRRLELPPIGYTYDWDLEIVVEKHHTTTSAMNSTTESNAGPAGYPRCTGGRRTAPPEDSGGIHAHTHLVAALADPDHLDRDNALDWLGYANSLQSGSQIPEKRSKRIGVVNTGVPENACGDRARWPVAESVPHPDCSGKRGRCLRNGATSAELLEGTADADPQESYCPAALLGGIEIGSSIVAQRGDFG
jgi:hypothetical protein